MHVQSYQAPNFVGAHPAVMKNKTLASTGAEHRLLAGTVLAVVTATGKLAVLDPGGSDGTENAACVLVEDVTIPKSGDAVANVYVHGEFRSAGLGWPSGITAPQTAAAIEKLASHGLYVK